MLKHSPIGEDEHHPCVELRQRLRNEVLAGLGEDGADEPQVEGVRGKTAVRINSSEITRLPYLLLGK